MDWDVVRAPTSVLLLVRLGDDHGVSSEVCLRGTGLSIDQLGDKSVETTAEQELTVIGNLLDAVDDADGLGLQQARGTTSPPTESGDSPSSAARPCAARSTSGCTTSI